MSTNTTESKQTKRPPQLFRCVPVDFLWLPKSVRIVLGWITIVAFALSFFSPVGAILLLFPAVWRNFPIIAASYAIALVISFLAPLREWEAFRKIGQLWYEIFEFSMNYSPEECQEKTKNELIHKRVILAMHPHGIVPFQAVLWAASGDQYFIHPETGEKLYGFGAAADVVQYVPFLRNVLGFLTAGSASYHVLKKGLLEGKVPSVDPKQRKVHGLFILPGGVAEIFISQPGRNAIFFKKRKGLIRLSIETGAALVPCYVFGGTDFFDTLTTSDSWIAKLSRKLRMGITFFWGRLGLPIPYSPRVSLCIGEPIPVPEVNEQQTLEQAIDLLHAKFLEEMVKLFNEHKALAGYPDAELEVL